MLVLGGKGSAEFRITTNTGDVLTVVMLKRKGKHSLGFTGDKEKFAIDRIPAKEKESSNEQ